MNNESSIQKIIIAHDFLVFDVELLIDFSLGSESDDKSLILITDNQ